MSSGIMLKLMGAVLILLAPVWFALSAYGRYVRRDRKLTAFLDLLSLSAGAIQSELMALPDLAQRLAREGPQELRPFWKKICMALSVKKQPFEEIWRQTLREEHLGSSIETILDKYPGIIRSYNTEQINRDLMYIQKELEEERLTLRRLFRRDFKMHTGIQLSAAFLLMILLF